MTRQYPELRLLHAIPNGGPRDKATAGKLRAEGVLPGIPDLHLPVARGGSHSLYIEMKNPETRSQPSITQRDMHEALRAEGHDVRVAWTWQEAAEIIVAYLSGTMGIVDTAMPLHGPVDHGHQAAATAEKIDGTVLKPGGSPKSPF